MIRDAPLWNLRVPGLPGLVGEIPRLMLARSNLHISTDMDERWHHYHGVDRYHLATLNFQQPESDNPRKIQTSSRTQVGMGQDFSDTGFKVIP